ncbi:CG6337, partial [Drosophila busckii]
MFRLLLCCVILCSSALAFNHGQQAQQDFENYKVAFEKNYATTAEENAARYFYNYHMNLVRQHNALADRNGTSYHVGENIFSDIRLRTFAARLPQAIYPTGSNAKEPLPTGDVVPPTFNLTEEFELTVNAADQGTVCSSSWAYSVAKAVQIMNAAQLLEPMPEELSAQSLIDCAGMGTGCSTQVPQTALDYLTVVQDTTLLPASEYANNNTLSAQGMCRPSSGAAAVVGAIKLDNYARIEGGDDEAVKRFVSSGFPVIVEYNPASFGFMHYRSGVYVPPNKLRAASSQFLVVLGFGHDTASNLDYWLCLNSFGRRWGENGYIKIVRDDAHPIGKRAVFPNSLG